MSGNRGIPAVEMLPVFMTSFLSSLLEAVLSGNPRHAPTALNNPEREAMRGLAISTARATRQRGSSKKKGIGALKPLPKLPKVIAPAGKKKK